MKLEKEVVSGEKVDGLRNLESVLSYWRDFDQYLIPEWPVGRPSRGSRTACDMNEYQWAKVLERILKHQDRQRKNGKDHPGPRYAIQVFFQCHYAQYLLKGPLSYYQKAPKLYLAAGLVTLEIKDRQLQATLLDNPDQWIFNRPLLHRLFVTFGRQFFRFNNVTDWYQARTERFLEIATHEWSSIYQHDTWGSISNLKRVLAQINSALAEDVFSHPQVSNFMQSYAAVDLVDCNDAKARNSQSAPKHDTFFGWRWLETVENGGVQQLGPFFTIDLSRVRDQVATGHVSRCLKDYVLGGEDVPLFPPNGIPEDLATVLSPSNGALGKWPSSPSFGLSTMQAYAQQIFLNQNGICAVNGPPGTGKTTLIKDVVANVFVRRTRVLIKKTIERTDLYGYGRDLIQGILDHAIVIASSNNSAVENISKELPSKLAVDDSFRADMKHFHASETNWGVFCAVLGNSNNRTIFFEEILNPLQRYLNSLLDPYKFKHLSNSLKKSDIPSATPFTRCWQQIDCASLYRSLKGNDVLATLADLIVKKASNKELETWCRELKNREQVIEELSQISKKHGEEAKSRALEQYKKSVEDFHAIQAKITEHYGWLEELAILSDTLKSEKADYENARSLWVKHEDEFLALEPEDQIKDQTEELKTSLDLLQQRQSIEAENKEIIEKAIEQLSCNIDLFQKQTLLKNLFTFGVALFGFVQRAQAQIRSHMLSIVKSEKEMVAIKSCLIVTRNQLASLERTYRLVLQRSQLKKVLDMYAEKERRFKELSENLDSPSNLDEVLLTSGTVAKKEDESETDYYERIQTLQPWACKSINKLQSQLFIKSLQVNQHLIEISAKKISWALRKELKPLLAGGNKKIEKGQEHRELWSLFFLCFPVVSTTYASAESQFKQLQGVEQLGYFISDESGQSKVYEPVGLLQRCKRALMVGDPLQLEPIVKMDPSLDEYLASQHLQDEQHSQSLNWRVSTSSAQILADAASTRKGLLGKRSVGIPMMVHRRCLDPMFSIANEIAYDGKMIKKTLGKRPALRSIWLDVKPEIEMVGKKYFNRAEIEKTLETLRSLENSGHRDIFVITPFTLMATRLRELIDQEMRDGKLKLAKDFTKRNVGTVHTFQGKEAEIVIFCLCAGSEQAGGIRWVNQSPNLINVAVTRAKLTLILIGDLAAWAKSEYGGTLSKYLGQI